MKIKMVCLEDGIMSCGFRKMAAYAWRLNPDTGAYYVSTQDYRDLRTAVMGTLGGPGSLGADNIDEIARGLADADLIGFSSMTGYAKLTRAIISRIRDISDKPFMIWGGIHPIIHPEDAIAADVDAICAGEGELAFKEFFDLFTAGRDHSPVKNFWFKGKSGPIRNPLLPLMTAQEMSELPFPQYAENEFIYKQNKGFVPLSPWDYVQTNGLSYNTVWSIGCPFHCNYCGNTKFIANDPKYSRIRHPGPRYVVDEVKAAKKKHPHISTVSFHDDSFMAIPYEVLEEFSELWRKEVDLPFSVYGVIPNYVKREKLEILTWAGLVRIRMGIQSGSQRILDFYQRPTPIEKVKAAAAVCTSFSPRYHIPPAFDFIVDNPIETRQDIVETLEMIYGLARPFTLNVFSLKVIPNTELEKAMKARGLDIDAISENYVSLMPILSNAMMYMLGSFRPPRWLFERMLSGVAASAEKQKRYPLFLLGMRALYVFRRGIDHLRFMDFSIISGLLAQLCWRSGLISFWRRFMLPRMPRPAAPRAPGETPPPPDS